MSITDIIRRLSPVSLTEEQLGLMSGVYEKLEQKNRVMNLTAITTPEEAAELHFADSLYALTEPRVKGDILDVGSGGGFPAFPVAIASGCFVTCLDSTAKKLAFIKETARELGIDNIDILCGRAEELSRLEAHREKYDAVLARGVARLNVLCEWCLPYVKPNGVFVALKGVSGREEADEAANAIKTLGGRLAYINEYTLPASGHTHTLVVIEKVARTPKTYPRRNSLISKKPL